MMINFQKQRKILRFFPSKIFQKMKLGKINNNNKIILVKIIAEIDSNMFFLIDIKKYKIKIGALLILRLKITQI